MVHLQCVTKYSFVYRVVRTSRTNEHNSSLLQTMCVNHRRDAFKHMDVFVRRKNKTAINTIDPLGFIVKNFTKNIQHLIIPPKVIGRLFKI